MKNSENDTKKELHRVKKNEVKIEPKEDCTHEQTKGGYCVRCLKKVVKKQENAEGN